MNDTIVSMIVGAASAGMLVWACMILSAAWRGLKARIAAGIIRDAFAAHGLPADKVVWITRTTLQITFKDARVACVVLKGEMRAADMRKMVSDLAGHMNAPRKAVDA